jgi:hypothetical protein
MFPFLLIFFLLFTAGYGAFIAIAIYHVKRYTIPEHRLPGSLLVSFYALSGILWLTAIISLMTLS